MRRRIKILASFMYGLLLSSNIALTSVHCKSIVNTNDDVNCVKTKDEHDRYEYAVNKLKLDKNLTKDQKDAIKKLFFKKYNERINKNSSYKCIKTSTTCDFTKMGLPPLKETSHYVYLKTSINNIEVEKKLNNKILLLAIIGSGIGGIFFKSIPIVENIVCGVVAIVAGYQYYLEKLPNDVLAYKEQYFRWTNIDKYKYEYKYFSGFKDKNGNELSKETYCKIGNFDYLVD